MTVWFQCDQGDSVPRQADVRMNPQLSSCWGGQASWETWNHGCYLSDIEEKGHICHLLHKNIKVDGGVGDRLQMPVDRCG